MSNFIPTRTRSALRTSGALVGACILVTRPVGTSASLIKRVRALGGNAVRLPGLSLRGATDTARTADALSNTGYRDWIFSSPAAVRFAFRLAPEMAFPGDSRVFAVGAGTARALARHGVQSIAPHTQSDSDGLLCLPELTDMRGRRVALVCAPGGRGVIAPRLRERGALVEPIHVYRRVPPRLTRRHFDTVAAASDPLVMLISSGEALGNLIALLPAPLLGRLHHQPLVVSSTRLAKLARTHGFSDIVEADSAMAADLLDAARWALARHRL